MPIEIPVTRVEVAKLKKELKKPQDFICLDPLTFIKANLVAIQIAGQVKAKIVKGYN